MFEKTKQRIDTLVNDRVAAPIRTSVVMSLTAVIIAGIALIVVVKRRGS